MTPRGPLSGEPGVICEAWGRPMETAAFLGCIATITAFLIYAVGALFHWWHWWA